VVGVLEIGGDLNSTKITDVPEEGILHWLFSDPIPRWTIGRLLGINQNFPIRFSVRAPFIPEFGTKPGDIDVLGLLDPVAGTAVAVEAKRLKIKPQAFSTGKLNKIPGLVDGARKANSLLGFGFARTVLFVVIVVDGSEQTDVHEIFRVPTLELDFIVKEALGTLQLETEIGLLTVTTVQNTKQSFRERGGLSPLLVRAPADRPQPEPLSRAIREYFSA
jgi:hypothetical protein